MIALFWQELPLDYFQSHNYESLHDYNNSLIIIGNIFAFMTQHE